MELSKLATVNMNNINSNPYESSFDQYGQPPQFQINYQLLGKYI